MGKITTVILMLSKPLILGGEGDCIFIKLKKGTVCIYVTLKKRKEVTKIVF